MRKVTAFALLLLVVLVLVFASMPACSCSDDDIEQPPLTSGSVVVTDNSAVPSTVVPDIRGRITSISVTSKTAVLMVEGDVNDDSKDIKYKKAWVTVDLKTAIGRENSSETVSYLSLTPGDIIEVWFSNSVAETDPVQAYAQAVKIKRKETSSESSGVVNLPKMVVNCGADSSLAAITNVTWNGQSYNYGSAAQVLETTIGSRVSVRCGETASLSFKMLPDSYTVSCYQVGSDAASTAVEPENGRISFPKDAPGEYIYTVTANYGENVVTYVFSVFAFL